MFVAGMIWGALFVWMFLPGMLRDRHAKIVEQYARGCITVPLTKRIAAHIRTGAA